MKQSLPFLLVTATLLVLVMADDDIQSNRKSDVDKVCRDYFIDRGCERVCTNAPDEKSCMKQCVKCGTKCRNEGQNSRQCREKCVPSRDKQCTWMCQHMTDGTKCEEDCAACMKGKQVDGCMWLSLKYRCGLACLRSPIGHTKCEEQCVGCSKKCSGNEKCERQCRPSSSERCGWACAGDKDCETKCITCRDTCRRNTYSWSDRRKCMESMNCRLWMVQKDDKVATECHAKQTERRCQMSCRNLVVYTHAGRCTEMCVKCRESCHQSFEGNFFRIRDCNRSCFPGRWRRN